MDKVYESYENMGLLVRDMDHMTVLSLEQDCQLKLLRQQNEDLEKSLGKKKSELGQMDVAFTEANTNNGKQVKTLTKQLETTEHELKEKHDEVTIIETVLSETKSLLEKKIKEFDEVGTAYGKKKDDLEKEVKVQTKKAASDEKRVELLNKELIGVSAKLERKECALDETIEMLEEKNQNFEEVEKAFVHVKLGLRNDVQALTKRACLLESELGGKSAKLEYTEMSLKKTTKRFEQKCLQFKEMDTAFTEVQLNRKKEVHALSEQNETLENELKKRSNSLKAVTGKFEEKTKDFDATNTALIDSNKQVKMLDIALNKRCDELRETETELADVRGNMELLLRNLEVVTDRNIQDKKKMDNMTASLLSLSVASSGIFIPPIMTKRLMSERTKALSLITAQPDIIIEQMLESNKKIMSEFSAIAESIQNAEPISDEGVAWEHFEHFPDDQSHSADSVSVIDQREIRISGKPPSGRHNVRKGTVCIPKEYRIHYNGSDLSRSVIDFSRSCDELSVDTREQPSADEGKEKYLRLHGKKELINAEAKENTVISLDMPSIISKANKHHMAAVPFDENRDDKFYRSTLHSANE